MRYGMSYFQETIWKGVPKFLRRVDTALKSIGINERLPYNVPLIKFSSWMGGDRDGKFIHSPYFQKLVTLEEGLYINNSDDFSSVYIGNPRVTPDVTRDVCLLARMMAANLYVTEIEDLMFEVYIVYFS
jgi:phosphoenolpyruvate carboxylase